MSLFRRKRDPERENRKSAFERYNQGLSDKFYSHFSLDDIKSQVLLCRIVAGFLIIVFIISVSTFIKSIS